MSYHQCASHNGFERRLSTALLEHTSSSSDVNLAKPCSKRHHDAINRSHLEETVRRDMFVRAILTRYYHALPWASTWTSPLRRASWITNKHRQANIIHLWGLIVSAMNKITNLIALAQLWEQKVISMSRCGRHGHEAILSWLQNEMPTPHGYNFYFQNGYVGWKRPRI